ncbi:hypothetical protein Tco_1389700, partial [Tanacetum coccineum]
YYLGMVCVKKILGLEKVKDEKYEGDDV